mmetsp:Transcript_10226/g.18461  ORF Transcript_10226/g.18461 Transcript_10226/m.18461 type:complete len:83 (-) Transcript_10226:152-400(-)
MRQPAHGKASQPREGQDQEEDDFIDPLVDQQGCGKVYAALEVCLGDNDRDWRKCQAEVQALRDCYARSKADTSGSPPPSAKS